MKKLYIVNLVLHNMTQHNTNFLTVNDVAIIYASVVSKILIFFNFH